MLRLRRLVGEIANVRRIAGKGVALRYAFEVIRRSPQIVRVGNLQPADEAMKQPLHVWLQGVELELPWFCFSWAREMYGRGVYFPNLGFHPDAGDTVVDLGANLGLFSLLAARKGAAVLAVEAVPMFIPMITELLGRNCASASVEWGLVGAGSGMFSEPANLARWSGGKTPPILSMNELIAKHAISQIDILKCDIEGSEFDLFGNENSWLAKVKRIAMEVHTRYGNRAHLVSLLREFGFAIDSRDPTLQRIVVMRWLHLRMARMSTHATRLSGSGRRRPDMAAAPRE